MHILTLWHSERPKLYTILAFLSAIGLNFVYSFPFGTGRIAQSVGHLTRKSEVLGLIPGLATYFHSPSADSRGAVVSYW